MEFFEKARYCGGPFAVVRDEFTDILEFNGFL